MMHATMAEKQSNAPHSPQQIQFGYQAQSNVGALSPKTEGGQPAKAKSMIDGGKNVYSDQKTEQGYVGGESTTDAQSQGELQHDTSRLSNAFGAQH